MRLGLILAMPDKKISEAIPLKANTFFDTIHIALQQILKGRVNVFLSASDIFFKNL